MPEVVVIGAGVAGASVAFHLAERGVSTLVLDAAGEAGGQTPRSGAIIRAHHSTVIESALTLRSRTEYYEQWADRVGGGCGFVRTGQLYLSDEHDEASVRGNVTLLATELGLDISLLAKESVPDIDPALSTDDCTVAAYEPRAGYADPTATVLSLLAAARRSGARVRHEKVESLLERGGDVVGVRTASGDVHCDHVVLCTGPWTASLTSGVGIDLPMRSARIQLAFFERPAAIPGHVAFVDVANDIYCRSASDGVTLVGRHAPRREWLGSPDELCAIPDPDFVGEAGNRLASRIPAMAGARYRFGRCGVLDMTPDARPILGPVGPAGLTLSVGWSGSGFGKAPAVGAELAAWIVNGRPDTAELLAFGPHRFAEGRPIRGRYEYSGTGPH